MRASEEIRAQREFLLANKHVHHAPSQPEEGCLILRFPLLMDMDAELTNIPPTCWLYIGKALRALYGVNDRPTHWNDKRRPPFTQVIEVLEYAEKLARQDEDE